MMQATHTAGVYNVQLITVFFDAYPLKKKNRGKEKMKEHFYFRLQAVHSGLID